MADELTGIFDHLDPDDFHESYGPNKGSEAFATWLEERLQECRATWASSNGRLDPVTVIADSHTSIVLPAIPPETLGQYAARCKREADRLGATWAFVARKTKVGTYPTTADDPTLPDATGDEETLKAAALEHGTTLVDGVYFYAARHEGDEIERKHGMIPSEHGQLGETVMGDADAQAVSLHGDLLA